MSGLLEFFSDVIGDNLPGAVAFAFIVYIATQIILSMFQHRADRRAYRYERSAATGRMRFEKESYHIEKLSSALLRLVAETEALCAKPGGRLSAADRARWIELHRECVARLGAAAPFINFLSPHDGSPCCGVRDDRAGAPSHAMRDSVSTGTNEEQAAKLREHLAGGRSKSLYRRAALLVDACRAALLGRGAPQTGTVLPADVFDADAPGYVSDVMAKELDLAARYERFADCAACRLRDSERGSRDGRWRRMKDWAANVWKWPFASIYHYFDAPCPYERGRPLSRGKVQARERRRTCAVVAAFVVLAAWAFFSCTSDQCFTVDRLWASSLSFPAFVLAALVVFLVISEREEVGNRRGECETEEASEPSDETT